MKIILHSRTLIILMFFLVTPLTTFCQSLNTERLTKIKDCTVRVSVIGGNSTGTGFTIDAAGSVVTCWHVLQSVLIFDAQKRIVGYRDILVEYNNGDTYKYGIPLILLQKSANLLLEHDICVIVPNERLKNQSQFLKIGNYNNLNEGEEVVTCGYPFGIIKQFVSKGTISTKSTDTASLKLPTGNVHYSNNTALIDITMNKGNSGGPIVKFGAGINTDEVVGIADFIITPVGKDVIDLSQTLDQANSSGAYVTIGGVNPNASLSTITKVITNISNGISGCISIEYLQVLIDSIK